LVVMDQFTRRLVGIGVHCGAARGADVCRMFNAAIYGQGVPRHLSTDHDPLFEAHQWTANLRILKIGEIKTVPHVPLSHPFVERLIGTMRREFPTMCCSGMRGILNASSLSNQAVVELNSPTTPGNVSISASVASLATARTTLDFTRALPDSI